MKFYRQLAAAAVLATAAMGAQADSPQQWQALTSNLQISLEQAVDKAKQVAPGTVYDIELDDGDGQGARYEAQVLTAGGQRVEVWVNATNGQAHQHQSDGQAKDKDVQRVQEAKIDILQAIEAAKTHTPGRAVKAELDSHWGKTSYQVEVLKDDYTVTEVKLDALDGTVLRAKRD